MYRRLLNPLKNNSFFLFGARGTGKSTLLGMLQANVLRYDLLDEPLLADLSMNPDRILQDWRMDTKKKGEAPWVLLDEVQRLPSLLNHVHRWIENQGIRFALTGSSARKLKRGGANLLAGRAFVFHLFPLTHRELGEDFSLESVLRWGSLPHLGALFGDEVKSEYLRAYVNTYLKEEIKEEQIVRNIDPFRRFLEVAAQASGKIVNYSRLARAARADDASVRRYFEILEDTLVGTRLDAFHPSIRKREGLKPKFYLFDIGVTRALRRQLSVPLHEGTSAFGEAFEHFIVLELQRLSEYLRNDFRFSYYKTKDDLEIDLVIERPGRPLALVEIKSSVSVGEDSIGRMGKLVSDFARDFGQCDAYMLYRGTEHRSLGPFEVHPWREGIEAILS